jgi:hypothetical protein
MTVVVGITTDPDSFGIDVVLLFVDLRELLMEGCPDFLQRGIPFPEDAFGMIILLFDGEERKYSIHLTLHYSVRERPFCLFCLNIPGIHGRVVYSFHYVIQNY